MTQMVTRGTNHSFTPSNEDCWTRADSQLRLRSFDLNNPWNSEDLCFEPSATVKRSGCQRPWLPQIHTSPHSGPSPELPQRLPPCTSCKSLSRRVFGVPRSRKSGNLSMENGESIQSGNDDDSQRQQ